MSHQVPALPAGTALLHIGPHKTGTTALQYACHYAREELAAYGVRYASKGRHDADAARYAAGGRPRRGVEDAAGLWADVVAALRDERYPRRIFSSESLANADDRAAARIVSELGRPHVVVSARPLAGLVPSQYQQLAQRGAVAERFEAWTESVFGRRDDLDTSLFWRRHRHDRQVRRWGELVGYENVTVLVVDGRDRRLLPETFERLLGVPRGVLADREVRSNRSLTATELELIRQFHQLCAEAGMTPAQRRRLSLQVCHRLQSREPEPGEPRLTLPGWAIEEANRRSAGVAERIAASGVRVVGDLGALSAVPRGTQVPAEAVATLDVRLAADFALGLALAR